jgi:hypothetical protein
MNSMKLARALSLTVLPVVSVVLCSDHSLQSFNGPKSVKTVSAGLSPELCWAPDPNSNIIH